MRIRIRRDSSSPVTNADSRTGPPGRGDALMVRKVRDVGAQASRPRFVEVAQQVPGEVGMGCDVPRCSSGVEEVNRRSQLEVRLPRKLSVRVFVIHDHFLGLCC